MQRSSQPQDIVDRREAPRVDVDGRYSMRLDPCDGRAPIDCSLIDFSVTGARLRLPKDIPLPDKVHVLIGNLSHNCRIAWRQGVTIGVDFIDEHHSIF
jgi:hypothetical protein